MVVSKNNLTQRLKKLNVVIASHIFASGPALDLEEYLKNKVKNLLFVGHPFPYREDKKSFYRLYKKGYLLKEHKAVEWNLPEALFYIKDAIYTIFWVGTRKEKIDLYIGSDNFTACLGLLLKKWGKVKKVVLYTIDYMPKRFTNPVMNFLYHYFDRQCLKKCKIVWNVSAKMAEARLDQKGIGGKGCAPQIVVPLGVWHKRIPKLSFSEKNKYQMIFLGHILEKQGLDVVLEAMPTIIESIPQIRLVILGSGSHEESLKKKARKLKFSKYVDFRGYIGDHHVVEEELTKSTLGIAMYKPGPESFTNWADPAKIKNYLGAGLPVILTSVPPIAKDLSREKCGIIAEYNKEDFARKVADLLQDTRKIQLFSKNAHNYSKQFDWDNVFEKALRETI